MTEIDQLKKELGSDEQLYDFIENVRKDRKNRPSNAASRKNSARDDK